MEITAKMVKDLREKTGVGMMDCKKALAESQGDFDKAAELLRKKGMATSEKRAGKEASEGIIASYIHNNKKIGVMAEINCETDFVAKTQDFLDFGRDICMHIAATNPMGITEEDVPSDVAEKEKEIFRAQLVNEGKPEKIIDKILEGKMKKYYTENCLLEQDFVKRPEIKIKDYLNEIVSKTGEKVVIRKFVRFQIG